MSYWDTSALATLYLVEPDSATFDALAQRPTPIRISPLVRYEARLAFVRREREGAIAANAAVVLSWSSNLTSNCSCGILAERPMFPLPSGELRPFGHSPASPEPLPD